ncbi:MAG: hypothetical protein U9M92_03440 [Patescibacteria group bacterium]|nr:hypothetical protein [Patescibacteria group bacterium]
MSAIDPPFLNLEYFFNLLYHFLLGGQWTAELPQVLVNIFFWVKLILLILTPFILALAVTLFIKLARIRMSERVDMHGALLRRASATSVKNERWEKVLAYLSSENSAEWKLAIIEADNMLDDMVKRLKTEGDNLGERLKSIEPSDFLTLDDAWEAHKVRNQIAHESDFVIGKYGARRVIERYKRVFGEFEYI